MRGVQAGAIVLIGIAAMNAGNYAYHLIAGRRLGPGDYSDVVALLALAGLVSLPLGGAQVAVARYVARFTAEGRPGDVTGLFRLGLVVSTAVAAAIAVVIVALTPVFERALGIGSVTAIALTALLTLPSLTLPVVLGVVQGLQRFEVFAAALTLGAVIRVTAVIVALAAGFGVAGTIGASVAGTTMSLIVSLVLVRHRLRGPAARIGAVRTEIGRFLVPVVTGLLALTSLTTVDVLVAKAALGGHEAGIYGGASLIGRVILYLPATIVTVLLPKVASRAARGEATSDILGASIGVTVALCAGTTAAYAAMPDLVVRATYGADYLDAAPLLWLFGVAMTLYAVINVLLFYHLARGAHALSWLLAGAAVVQLAVYTVVHGSPYQLIAVSIAGAVAVLVLHEVFIAPALSGAARAGARLATAGDRR